MLNPNSAHTRPGGENLEKKFKKNFKKLKKLLSGVIFSENGMRQDEIGRERDKRILDPNSAHTRRRGENSEKKLQKNSKKLKNNFPALDLEGTRQAEIGQERD